MSKEQSLVIGLIKNRLEKYSRPLPTKKTLQIRERHDMKNNSQRYIKRGILKDSKNDSVELGIEQMIIKNESALGTVNYASSSHTTAKLGEKPGHLVAWWLPLNDKPETLNDLSNLSPKKQADFLEVIGRIIDQSVDIFHKKGIHKGIYIYGLSGYSNQEERRKTGLGKGAQTNCFGHINIVHFGAKDKQPEPGLKSESQKDLFKQVGPMDNIIMERWGGVFKRLINNYLTQTGLVGQVSIVSVHRQSEKTHKLFDHDDLRIVFNEIMPVKQAFKVLVDIVGQFKKVYNNIFSMFENNHFCFGDEGKLNVRKKTYFTNMTKLGLTKEESQEMLDFAFQFRPTLGQVGQWLKKHGLIDSARNHLEDLKERYEKLYDFLSKRNKGGEVSLDILLLKQMLGLTDNGDMPEFVWAKNLSITYSINDWTKSEEGSVMTKELRISPRLFSSKGALESRLGMVIKRQIPQ